MRTLMTLLALAVLGATAPAAPYTLRHVPGTLGLFLAAVIAVLGTCILSGWLISEVWSARPAAARLAGRLSPRPVDAGLPAEWAPQSAVSSLMTSRRAT